MPVGAAIGGAAVIGGVATSNAASRNARAATSVADQNDQLQREIYNQNRTAMQPYADGGNRSFTAWQNLMGLGEADPEGRTITDYLRATPGYQFNLDEGMRAQNASLASRGGLLSGDAGRAAIRFGQNYGDRVLNQERNALMGGVQIGVSATNALSGASTAFGNAVSANNNNALAGNTAANNARAGAISDIAGAGAGAFAYGQGNNWGRNALQSSYSAPTRTGTFGGGVY